MEPCSYHWGVVTWLRLGSLHDLLLGPCTPLLQELSAVELFSGRSTIVLGFRRRSHRSYLWNLMGVWCASRFWLNMTNHHPKCSKYDSYAFLGINYYKIDWAPKMIQGPIALARSFGSDRFCMLGTCGDLQRYNCGWMHLSWKTPKWNVLTLPTQCLCLTWCYKSCMSYLSMLNRFVFIKYLNNLKMIQLDWI